jgi:hypothetical protein
MIAVFLPSKLGRLLSGAYLALLLIFLIIAFGGESDGFSGLVLMGVTAPWSFFVAYIFETLNLELSVSGQKNIAVAISFFLLSGLPNVVILYFLGRFITKLRSE